jgi:Tc toxin complex TcA C-terminal TcB-binding domain
LGASAASAVAAALTPIPSVNVHIHFLGLGASSEVTSGKTLASVSKYFADIAQIASTWEQDQAAMTSRYASYERRADEWLFQYNLAAHELMQIGRQILTSLITEQIAHHEYQSIQQQIANAQEVDRFLHGKFTNEDLCLWMQGEISRLYYEYYRFAFDTARKAERTMKQELMRPELDSQNFVKFNYWDGGRKGLLSGEALYLDVKRMEMAYLDNNKRELELTRHVSLRQLDPLALLTLKSTGTCTVTIPEWLYDRDCPGHYMRRIKTVAISIPSVVGPYTSVNCTLSLLKSTLRKSPVAGDDYARQGSDDDRFVDYVAGQSVVTSTASNDSGLFETNLRDERFLPFEGAGAEGTWKLELPQDYRAFDYATISDVILHIRYTARRGVDPSKVKAALAHLFEPASQSILSLLFNLRHDFSTEWAAFLNGADFASRIRKDHFPYFTQEKEITIRGIDVYGPNDSKHHSVGDEAAWNVATTELATNQGFTVTAGPTEVLTRTASAEVFLIIRYSITQS